MQNLIFSILLPKVLGVPLVDQMQPRAIKIRELFEVCEAASNTYHWSVLQLAQLLAELPYNISFATVMYCITYFMINYDRATTRAGYFWFSYCFLYSTFWTIFGLAITPFVPDAATANIATSFFYSMIMNFSGIFQPVSLFPHF